MDLLSTSGINMSGPGLKMSGSGSGWEWVRVGGLVHESRGKWVGVGGSTV